MKVKEIIKIIEMDGWYEVRQKGSHRQYNIRLRADWSQCLFIVYQMTFLLIFKKAF